MKLTNTFKMKQITEMVAQEIHPTKMHHPTPMHHVPPHVRKNMIQIEFDDEDKAIFYDMTQDEDSAEGWMKILQDAPPEIKIIANQIIKMIREVV